MRSLRHALGLVALCAVASCNAILGVEDVHRKSPTTGDAGSSSKPGDDDDTTGITPVQPTSNPTGTKPDSGTPLVTPCGGAQNAACERTAFVTRATFTGNLGGTTGADDLCNTAAANNPSLKGVSFRAWISDVTEQATSRLPQGTKAYKRTDGVVIADSWGDIIDGTLMAQLNLDEMGKALDPSSLEVWTGTKSDGTLDDPGTAAGPNDCFGWADDSTDSSGTVGDASVMNGSWTDKTILSCNAQNHLYCLEY